MSLLVLGSALVAGGVVAGGVVAGGLTVLGPVSLAGGEVAAASEASDHLDVGVVWPNVLRDDPTRGSVGISIPAEPAVPAEPAEPAEPAAPDEPAEPAVAPPDDPEDLELSTASVQRRLRAQNYLVGPADGGESAQARAAVMAFQRVHGLEVDGVVGPLTTAALHGEPIEPALRGGADDRIEVDLDLQLLHLVEGGVRTVTFHVSSGNGTEYVASSGNQVRANTPIGEFEIERRIRGVRHANLGVLHDPLYFHRGFAIHGAPSVPAEPASLGCVRVTIADGAWLIDRVTDGMPVHLYGGEHVYSPPGK